MSTHLSPDQSSAQAQNRRRTYGVQLRRGPRLRLLPAKGAPDQDDLQAVRRWCRSLVGPTAIDLFCGAGGLSLGLADAGFNVVVGADNDPLAIETHRSNLGGLGYVGDLTDPTAFLRQLKTWGVRHIDLVAGGVPCQPFSRAGRSKISSLVAAGNRVATDHRAGLWRSFVEIVRVLRPRAVLFENVPDLAEWDEGAILVGFCESLRSLGYAADPRILNAFDFGVPQHRARLFIVGVRTRESFGWPRPSPKREVSVRSAIGDLPTAPPDQRRERLRYTGPRTWLQKRLRRGVAARDKNFVDDHITRGVRVDDAEAFALLKEGQTYNDLPTRLQRYRADIFSDKYKRLSWRDLSRSITAHIAKDGYWYIHPGQDRTLSVREAARLQTFPDWFRFAGEPSHRYRQIGNAVPPLLAEAIGRRLRIVLDRNVGHRKLDATTPRAKLLDWHRSNARSFPWRDTGEPWHVLLAEMCLHRTRAIQVLPVYHELRRIAPTPAALLENEGDARRVLRSLGLHWRADCIVDVARVLVDQFGGTVPDGERDLLSLPGVGEYAAGAVLVFGHNRKAVLLDTNTSRIVSRLRGRGPSSRHWQQRLDLYELAGLEGPDAAFTYALLDLGAAVCTARNPRCSSCPLRLKCLATSSIRPA